MTLAPHRLLRRLAPTAAVFALLGGWAAAQSPSSAQSFTIAVIPDTQNYIDYTQQTAAGFPVDGKAMFMEQMSYVAGRLVSQGGDIAFVTGMGDVWQHQSLQIDPDHAARGFKRAPNPIMDHMFAPTPMVREQEMPVAAQGYALLAGKTPFSVVPGNHDYDAMWTDSSHPPAKVLTHWPWSRMGTSMAEQSMLQP